MIASFDIGEVNFAYAIGTKDALCKLKYANIIVESRQSITQSCKQVSLLLEQENFEMCEKVIIEQQMTSNIRAQRLAQHVWSWFYIRYPLLNPEFISASIKTVRKLTYRQRKQFAIDSMMKLLTIRNDKHNLAYINSLPKRDDVADAYIQLIEYVKRTEPVKLRRERRLHYTHEND